MGVASGSRQVDQILLRHRTGELEYGTGDVDDLVPGKGADEADRRRAGQSHPVCEFRPDPAFHLLGQLAQDIVKECQFRIIDPRAELEIHVCNAVHELAPAFAGFLLGEVHKLGGALLHARVTLNGPISGLSWKIVSRRAHPREWPLTSA